MAPRGLLWNIEVKHKYDEQQLQDELQYTSWINLADFQHQDTLCHRSHPPDNLYQYYSAQLFWGLWLQKEITCLSFQAMWPFHLKSDVHPILPSMEWTQRNFWSSILFCFDHNFCFVFLLSRPPCIPTKCDQTGQTDHTPPAGTSCWSPPLSPSPGCTRVEGGLARYHGSHFTPQT